jgi:hypothetical protein
LRSLSTPGRNTWSSTTISSPIQLSRRTSWISSKSWILSSPQQYILILRQLFNDVYKKPNAKLACNFTEMTNFITQDEVKTHKKELTELGLKAIANGEGKPKVTVSWGVHYEWRAGHQAGIRPSQGHVQDRIAIRNDLV